jgi:hypothetical protein
MVHSHTPNKWHFCVLVCIVGGRLGCRCKGLAKFWVKESGRPTFIALCSGNLPGGANKRVLLLQQLADRAATLLNYQTSNDYRDKDAARAADLRSHHHITASSSASTLMTATPTSATSSVSPSSPTSTSTSGVTPKRDDVAEASHVALLLWSLAELEYDHDAYIDAAALHVIDNIDRYASLDLGNIMIGIGRLRKGNWSAFDSIAANVETRRVPLKLSHLSSVLWCMARCNYQNASLMTYIAGRYMSTPSELISNRDAAQLLWSLAQLGYIHQPMYVTMALLTLDRLSSYTSVQISNSLWAFAAASIHPGDSLLFRARALIEDKLSRFSDRSLVAVIWALATFGVDDDRLYQRLSREAERRFPNDNNYIALAPQLLWSLAAVHHLPLSLYNKTVTLINDAPATVLAPHLMQLHQLTLYRPPSNTSESQPDDKHGHPSHIHSHGGNGNNSTIPLSNDIVSMSRQSVTDEAVNHDLIKELLSVVTSIDPLAVPLYQSLLTGYYRLDCAIVDRRIAIDIVPSSSYLTLPSQLSASQQQSSYVSTGSMLYRDQQLRGMGWRTLRVSVPLWNQLSDADTKRDYINDWIRSSIAANIK